MIELPQDDSYLVERLARINNLGKRSLQDQLTIGRLLDECRSHIAKGWWTAWLHVRLNITVDTAVRYIRAYRFSESEKGKQLVGFGMPYITLSLLHNASEDDIETVLELTRSKGGQAPEASVVKHIVARTRALTQVRDQAKPPGRRAKRFANLPAQEAVVSAIDDAVKADALVTIKRFIRDHRPKKNWNDIAIEAISFLAATIDRAHLSKIEGSITTPLVAAE
jgi:hypothetical protein